MSLRRKATVKKGSGSANHADQPEHKESDILIDRFLEYKSITKGFIAYYEDLAKLEVHTASELQRIGGHIPVPLKDSSQFLPHNGDKPGWQNMLYTVRDNTRAIAEQHTALAHTISEGIVHALSRTKTEIKHFIEELQAEPQRLAKSVGAERAESTKLILMLNQGVATAKSNPLALTAKEDPVLTHRSVEAQLKKQVNMENSLTQSLIVYQRRAGELEAKVISDLQAATGDLNTAYVSQKHNIAAEWDRMHTQIRALDPHTEWDEYAKRSGHLIPENVPMRDTARISFPGQGDGFTKPVKDGFLERKKRFTKNYKQSFYVLSPAGYLHEFKSSDPTKWGDPEMSLFLPSTVLGPPAQEGGAKYKWHVESSKDTKQGSLSKVKRSLHVGNNEVAYSFKARSHAEMMEWWTVMEGPAKASLTAATTSSNLEDGSAVAAVRDLGLAKEPAIAAHPVETQLETAADAEEEAGGSSEEEEAVDAPETAVVDEATHGEAQKTEVLPEYEKGAATVPTDTKEKPTLSSDEPVASTSGA